MYVGNRLYILSMSYYKRVSTGTDETSCIEYELHKLTLFIVERAAH